MMDPKTREWVYVSDEDALKLIEHSRPRWKLFLKFAYYYGLRVSEILSLKPEHFRNGTFVFPRFKHGLTPHLHVKPEIAEELAQLLKRKRPGTRLFPWTRKAAYNHLQQTAHRAGVDPRVAHIHAFRHRLGRMLARKGASPHQIAGLMGHRSMRASLMYSQIAGDEKLSREYL